MKVLHMGLLGFPYVFLFPNRRLLEIGSPCLSPPPKPGQSLNKKLLCTGDLEREGEKERETQREGEGERERRSGLKCPHMNLKV
jgi:hypothetical protein